MFSGWFVGLISVEFIIGFVFILLVLLFYMLICVIYGTWLRHFFYYYCFYFVCVELSIVGLSVHDSQKPAVAPGVTPCPSASSRRVALACQAATTWTRPPGIPCDLLRALSRRRVGEFCPRTCRSCEVSLSLTLAKVLKSVAD